MVSLTLPLWAAWALASLGVVLLAALVFFGWFFWAIGGIICKVTMR